MRHGFRFSLVLLSLSLLCLVSTSASMAAASDGAVHSPPELTLSSTKDRSSYNHALTELNEFMRQHEQVATYEESVDAFGEYRPAISPQEIAETLYHMYSGVGPKPANKYFGVITAAIGARSKTSGCQIAGALQDKACTPGAIISTASKDAICVSGYSTSVRNVSDSTKAAVYAEYGIASHASGQYEVDHLISLELGGSNDIANLWPEAASPTPGFHEKDTVENSLHDKVCNGSITLQDTQKEIATNWLALYVAPKTVTPVAKKVTPAPAPTPTTSGSSNAYYANCTAARAAGVTPIYRGQPGYRSALDRDGDGIACE